MGRPREHDPQLVTEGVVRAFHSGGYENTSFSDLETATGLDRAQLSRCYGSKRDLFILALERTLEIGWTQHLEPLAERGGIKEVRQFLMIVPNLVGTEAGEVGCLVCNTSHEPIAASDPQVRALVKKHFKRIEKSLGSALRNAANSGEIRLKNAEIRRVARLLYAVHVSLMVLLRSGESRAVLRDIANSAVDGIL